MIMSNFIDEAERFEELYHAFTSRQQQVLKIVTEATLASRDADYITGREDEVEQFRY